MDERMCQEVRECALRLLSRREHSTHELALKLHQRGYAPCVVEVIIAELARERWLSDERYAAALVYSRRKQGYGPLRIRAELRHHRVDEAL
ncbi:MAG TPA: regulatory protein RecX, partial [Nitrococcus sp.]|nr:regulatory protein RecX [Nitrococcus sp.]